MAQKDVIYLDIEDDITSAIGKFKKTSSKIVALVPPKRTTMLTSLVNLRLLKKAADDTDKKLVLITTDDTLRNLAGGLEMYVAKNLTTAPEVPAVTGSPELPSDIIDEDQSDVTKPTPAISDPTPEVGKTAAATGLGATIASKFKKLKPMKKEKGLPDFASFRKKIILVLVALIVLIGGSLWARNALPQAVVSLRGQTSAVTVDEQVRFSTKVEEADIEENVLPALRQTVEATQEVKQATSGEKNVGDKASGELTIENCMQSSSFTLSEGTRIRYATGLIYRTTEPVTVPGGSFSFAGCVSPGTASVNVEADQPGDNYNVAAASSESCASDSYDVVNFTTAQNDSLCIDGTAMAGGTTENIKVVSKADIEEAKDKLTDDDLTELEEELATQFEGEVVVLSKTITTDGVDDQVSHNEGDEAQEITVVRTASYSVFAVDRAVYDQYLREKLQSQIGEQQAVLDTGIDSVTTALVDATTEVATLQIKARGVAGPDVDIPALQQQLAGLGYTEGIQTAESIPGILKADIELSPFWANGMPKRAENIEITLEITGVDDQETDETAPAEETSTE